MTSQEQAWKTAEDECKPENDDDYDGGGDDGMAMIPMHPYASLSGRPVACKTALEITKSDPFMTVVFSSFLQISCLKFVTSARSASTSIVNR